MRCHFWLKVILLSILPIAVFADSSGQSYYYVAATDVSMSYLSNMFGTVGDVLVGGSSTPLIANVFYYFNKGVYLFTATLLTYIVISSVIAASNEGTLINDKLNAWIIIRSGLGIALLVPLTSGYCMMQVIVMSCVKQGIGLANSMWSEAVYNISSAGGFDNVTQDTTSASQANISDNPSDQLTIAVGNNTSNYSKTTPVGQQASFMQLFRSSYCAYTVYQYDKAGAAQNNAATPLSANYGYFLLSDNTLCFGSKSSSTSGAADTYNCQCGQYAFDDTDALQQANVITNMMTMANLMYGYAQSAYNQVDQNNPAAGESLDTSGSTADMDQICQVLSSSNTNQGNCLPGVSVWTYAGDYMQYVAGYQSGQINSNDTGSDCPDWVSEANTQGWIMAAANYANLVQTNQASCSNSNTVSPLSTFMPIASNANGNNIITVCTGGSCVDSPCMTSASGFSDDELCNSSLMNNRVQSNWNVLYTDSNTWQGMMQNMFADGNSGDNPLGMGYLASLSSSSYYDDYSDPITSSTFNNYYNKMLAAFLDNFVLNIYQPGSVGYDMLTNGSAGLVVNGGMTLVTKIVGTVLGINVYPNQTPDQIFSYDNMSSGPLGANGKCTGCYNNGNPSYSGSACYQSGSNSSCVDGNGYGLFGMVAKEANSEVYIDPLSSVASLGRTMLQFTLGFITNLIDNIYVAVKNTMVDILTAVIGVALGLSALGFMGFLNGSALPYIFPVLQAMVEILFKIHTTILFTYLPFVSALAVIFATVGLLLGVYLPFLPFIMFTAGTISWFINVVEAMVAAPLVAMGVTHPKGHELLGKAEQAMILLLSVFLRPATMIIGFISAIALSYASLYLLNLTFAYAFTIGLEQPSYTSSGYGTAVLGGILYIIIYAYSCYAILSQTFSLIFQVPDKVMRWIGMPRDSTSQDAMGMLQGSRSGFMDSAGGAARSGIQGSTQQARASAPDANQTLRSIKWTSTARGKDKAKPKNITRGSANGPTTGGAPGGAATNTNAARTPTGVQTGLRDSTSQAGAPGTAQQSVGATGSSSSSTTASGRDSVSGRERDSTSSSVTEDNRGSTSGTTPTYVQGTEGGAASSSTTVSGTTDGAASSTAAESAASSTTVSGTTGGAASSTASESAASSTAVSGATGGAASSSTSGSSTGDSMLSGSMGPTAAGTASMGFGESEDSGHRDAFSGGKDEELAKEIRTSGLLGGAGSLTGERDSTTTQAQPSGQPTSENPSLSKQAKQTVIAGVNTFGKAVKGMQKEAMAFVKAANQFNQLRQGLVGSAKDWQQRAEQTMQKAWESEPVQWEFSSKPTTNAEAKLLSQAFVAQQAIEDIYKNAGGKALTAEQEAAVKDNQQVIENYYQAAYESNENDTTYAPSSTTAPDEAKSSTNSSIEQALSDKEEQAAKGGRADATQMSTESMQAAEMRKESAEKAGEEAHAITSATKADAMRRAEMAAEQIVQATQQKVLTGSSRTGKE